MNPQRQPESYPAFVHVTTSEAAQIAGVTPATLRKWRQRGYIQPVRRATWLEDDVLACAAARIPAQRHAHLDDAWARLQASL